MSEIYIPGMEMPTSCYVCPFCDYVSARCDAAKGNPYTPESRYEKRADFCPLVPVPPHGRLIDADALKSDGFHTLVCCTGKMPYEYTAMLIDDVPTIIPADPADKEGEG